MSTFLLVAFLLGIANVVLAIRRSLWNYLFGLALAALWGFGFARVHLLREAAMHALFFAAQIYGIAEWQRSLRREGEVRVAGVRGREWAAWIAGGAVLFAVWGAALARFTYTTTPWMEAGVVALSLVALLLLARRRVETWPVWIAADILSMDAAIDMMSRRDQLRLLVFPLLSAVGWLAWRRAARGGQPAAADQRPGNLQART